MQRKHLFTCQITLFFLILLALIVQSGRLLNHAQWGKWDLTGQQLDSLNEETHQFLNTFSGKVAFTYFVTPVAQMPAHLKRVVYPVENLLGALKAASPNKISYRVIDPDLSGNEGQSYAARKKASPFSVRTIKQDEHSERDVWSSLIIAPEGHKEILIQKITPEDLPFLENLILTHLKSLNAPPLPTLAISSPNYTTLFTEFAKQYGTVKNVDIAQANQFPFDADVLIWLEPQNIEQSHIRALERFIRSGKTVILAGSSYVIDYGINDANQVHFQTYPTGTSWESLLAPFGIRPQPDLLMDESQGPIFFRDAKNQVRQADAPFHLRVMPGAYNLKGFLSPARGALNFVGASPLEIEPRKVTEAGFGVDILATTTEKAYVQALPQEHFTQTDIKAELNVGKQNLMLRLSPENPWQGELLILGTTSPFRDGIFNQPNYGHRVFLQTVLRTYTEPSRIVKGRVTRPQPPTLPELSNVVRLIWRGVVVFFIPLIILIVGIQRHLSHGGAFSPLRGMGNLPFHVVGGFVILLLASRLWAWHSGLMIDFTAESIHTPKAFTQNQLANKQIKADLIIPTRASLPSALKPIEKTVTQTLKKLDIPITLRRPETLTPQDRARLGALGIKPFELQAIQDDQQISQWILSSLLIHKPGAAAVIPRLDEKTIDHLEYHLLTAELRLNQGKTPHIALISEPPRLSPAEAFEYHQQQLTPPKGADVFREIQTLLRTYGYRVTYINPREPIFPPDADLIVWMQPRRDATKLTELFSQYLALGGNGLVALQHFNIQQSQYRGSGFQTVYWPQPQYQDLNPYLEPLGLGQIREVLLDETKSRLSLETQINRTAVREFEAQEVTLPFLIRAVGPYFNAQSPNTRQLGDQLFNWG
ncbi:MAG: Gldg family protein, partial [Candidatus Latescibacterota bacterium]